MERFPTIEPQNYSDDQRKVVETIVKGPREALRGPFPALLHVPELANLVQALGGYLRFRTSLTPPNRELIILITGRFWGAQYEWYAHREIGLEAGLKPEIADQLARGEHPKDMSEEQETIYAFCTELHLNHHVSDATFARAETAFGRRAVLEMIGLSGYYTLVSMVLNTARVPLPAGAVPIGSIDRLAP